MFQSLVLDSGRVMHMHGEYLNKTFLLGKYMYRICAFRTGAVVTSHIQLSIHGFVVLKNIYYLMSPSCYHDNSHDLFRCFSG